MPGIPTVTVDDEDRRATARRRSRRRSRRAPTSARAARRSWSRPTSSARPRTSRSSRSSSSAGRGPRAARLRAVRDSGRHSQLPSAACRCGDVRIAGHPRPRRPGAGSAIDPAPPARPVGTSVDPSPPRSATAGSIGSGGRSGATRSGPAGRPPIAPAEVPARERADVAPRRRRRRPRTEPRSTARVRRGPRRASGPGAADRRRGRTPGGRGDRRRRRRSTPPRTALEPWGDADREPPGAGRRDAAAEPTWSLWRPDAEPERPDRARSPARTAGRVPSVTWSVTCWPSRRTST